MAYFTMTGGFPPGTTVSVYNAKDVKLGQAPSGASVASGTMGSSTLTFTGLGEQSDYAAYAVVDGVHRYKGFRTGSDEPTTGGNRDRIETLESRMAVLREAPLNPMDDRFGAVGDGSTNDYPAIQDALNTAGQAVHDKGGAVILPNREFRIWQQLNINYDNVKFYGFGGRSNASGAGSNPHAGGAILSVRPVAFSGSWAVSATDGVGTRCLSSVLIDGIAIHCANTSTGGVYMQTMKSRASELNIYNSTGTSLKLESIAGPGNFPQVAYDNVFERLDITGTGGTSKGLHFHDSSDNFVHQCLIANVENAIYGDPGVGGLHVKDGHFAQIDGPAIKLLGQSAAAGLLCEGTRFHDVWGALWMQTWGRGTWYLTDWTATLSETAATNTHDVVYIECDSAHLADRLRSGVIADGVISLKAGITAKWRNGINIVNAQVDRTHISNISQDWDSGAVTSAIQGNLINDNGTKTMIDGCLHKSATWDPAATAASQGARVSTTISVPGAVVGDTVSVSHSAYTTAQDVALNAYVSAADTVTAFFTNTTAAAVNVGSGTLSVRVHKPQGVL